MIKLIFFDVGGTLIRPHPSVGEIYARCAKRHGMDISPSTLEEKFKTAWKAAKQKSPFIDKTWWRNTVQAVFQGVTFGNFEAFFEDLYQTFDDPASWRIFPDVHTTLPRLKQQGIRLAVASNWDSRLPPLLDRLDLSRYFDKQFISFDINCAKPDPAFFTNALQKMGENPLEAFHGGDDPIEDVQCAEQAGLRAYLIDRTKKPINSRMLSSLDDLLLRV